MPRYIGGEAGAYAAEHDRVHIPDIMAEYTHEQITVFGITGTPEELLTSCPIPHERMTLEAKNMFLVTAINESGMQIKQEHMAYFKEVLDSRDMEVKVTVREEAMADESIKFAAQQGRVHSNSRKGAMRAIRSHIKPEATQIIAEDPSYGAGEVVYRDTETPEASFTSSVDITTTEQMDIWLSQMQAEYTQYVADSKNQTIVPNSDAVEKNVPPRGSSAAEGRVSVVDEDFMLTISIDSREYNQEELAEVAKVHAEQPRLSEEGVFGNSPADTIDVSAAGTVLPEDGATEVVMQVDSKPARDGRVEILLELTNQRNVSDGETSGDADKGANSPAEVLSDAIATNAIHEISEKLPPILMELLAEVEKGDIDQIVTVEMEATETDASLSSDSGFANQLVEYVRSLPENPETSAKEKPTAIMEQVLEVAVKIQEMQANETVGQEVVKGVKGELEVLCVKLLESLGVEPDEKMVMLLVEKILASEDLSEISLKKLSPEELAKQGTHEYKLENWFNKFKQLLDDSTHPHRIVGRIALSIIGTAP